MFRKQSIALFLELLLSIAIPALPQVEPEILRESLRHNCAGADRVRTALDYYSQAFDESFSLIDVHQGKIIHADHSGLSCDFSCRMEILAEVARRGLPEIIEEVAPLAMLAMPLRPLGHSSDLVAVGTFVQQQVVSVEQMSAAARIFGVDCRRALRWSECREIWPTRMLLRVAKSIQENLVQQEQLAHLRHEINEAVSLASETYDELGLLHRLTSRLHLSGDETEVWQNALTWLADSIPAQCLAIISNQPAGVGNQTHGEEQPKLPIGDPSGVLTHGQCPTENSELREVIENFSSTALGQPIVLNRAETSLPTWSCKQISELVCVPISGGDQPMGWLLALNHRGNGKDESDLFGSVEVRLLGSVGTILGIHNSNLDLYQQQSELFESSVKALTSAIDAKDGYTSGHSDRVARIAVALAEEIGLDQETLDTLYLGGLLHDIGKIGIDDHILNKPGKLTGEEFKHVQQHPQLGYEILRGVRQLDKVLPLVLHHHEAWNGMGYPHGLKGSETPQVARIMAVADAYDAMSSDRPYRKGMPDEKVDAILREGAGSQWDAEVIDAFFSIRDEIRQMSQETPSGYVPAAAIL